MDADREKSMKKYLQLLRKAIRVKTKELKRLQTQHLSPLPISLSGDEGSASAHNPVANTGQRSLAIRSDRAPTRSSALVTIQPRPAGAESLQSRSSLQPEPRPPPARSASGSTPPSREAYDLAPSGPQHDWKSPSSPFYLPHETRRVYFQYFFEQVTPRCLPCALIRPKELDSFIEACPNHLQCMIVSLGIWFSHTLPQGRTAFIHPFGPRHEGLWERFQIIYSDKARRYALEELDRPSFPLLQCFLLLAHHAHLMDQRRKAIYYVDVAARLVWQLHHIHFGKTAASAQADCTGSSRPGASSHSGEELEILRRSFYHCTLLELKLKSSCYGPYVSVNWNGYGSSLGQLEHLVTSASERRLSEPPSIYEHMDQLVFLQEIFYEATPFLSIYNNGPPQLCPDANAQMGYIQKYHRWRESRAEKLWLWFDGLPAWVRDLAAAARQRLRLPAPKDVGGTVDSLSLLIAFYCTVLCVEYPRMIEELWTSPYADAGSLPTYRRCQMYRESIESLILACDSVDPTLEAVNIGTVVPFITIWTTTLFIHMAMEPESSYSHQISLEDLKALTDPKDSNEIQPSDHPFVRYIKLLRSVRPIQRLSRATYRCCIDAKMRRLVRVRDINTPNLRTMLKHFGSSNNPAGPNSMLTALGPWLPRDYLELCGSDGATSPQRY
ncbi:uncharacterized protein BJ171DRAFT_489159 [Polychytrium aggregatum]|uniref:uncharacterized protein n=1 Tax=Polychytrium aggregatum TaxID=110093 RepID=UPI0022FEC57A|nr:uncharacterized protein BJ171DRAFT_539141 [Polychytrium aggregatum]XP_052970591.1 uncharacterized protein BJ171DRAFT_489159 [Polychytrium aggregatum]KAI9190852.1 hypothetical protein BJ171DRAFT_539141 [Polychytrium aggregatum]KAI9208511.1 hypothetical protein BJ171DRAFT_489159 [Polychytrium aggregatum]